MEQAERGRRDKRPAARILKKILGAALVWTCFLGGAAYGATAVTAQGGNTVVLVNGVAREVYPYNIGGSNYFKLRDMAAILSTTDRAFSVEWDAQKNAIVMETGAPYELMSGDLQFPAGASAQTAEPSQAVLYCDGEPVDTLAYNIGGNNYFKLRDIGTAADFAVYWNEETQLMEIYTETVEPSTASSEVLSGDQRPDEVLVSDGDPMEADFWDDAELPNDAENGGAIELDASFTDPNYWDNLAAEQSAQQASQKSDTASGEAPLDPNGEIITDVRQLLNSAPLNPQQTQFGVLNSLVDEFMRQNFTAEMDTYTKAKVAYDYFIRNMTYQTATELDMSMFTRDEASVIWQCYAERYAVPILLDHKGVCNHYSAAYAAILRAVGLDVRVVSGTTKSSAGGYSSHVWVTVRVNGVDYLFDPQVEQRIAQRNGGNIQYYRFGRAVSTMQNDYRPSAQYRFVESLFVEQSKKEA